MDSGAERAEAAESEQDEEEDVYEVERIIDTKVEDVSAKCELAGWLVHIMLTTMPSC